MRNLWLVVRREYVSRLRSGAYIVSTLAMVVLFLGTTMAPVLFQGSSAQEPLKVALLDRTRQAAGPLEAALKAGAAGGARQVALEVAPAGAAEEPYLEQARRGSVGVLVVEGEWPLAVKARFLAGSIGVMTESRAVLGPLEGLVRNARMQAKGIDPATAQEIMQPMAVEELQLSARGGEASENQMNGSMLLAIAAMMAVYIVTLLNGSFVFNGVLEEKVSRVMEVMAASVKPGEMLAAKIIGLGALGLTQFVLMVGAWFLGHRLTGSMTSLQLPTIGPGVALLMLLFLLLGYALSATLMAAAAATISRMEDSQTLLMPITMLNVLPMLMMVPVLNDPNGRLATIGSLVPILSPALMVVRLVMTDVPVWQIATAVGLMLLAVWGSVWAGARVYRAAMLSYGGRPTLRQILAYLRA